MKVERFKYIIWAANMNRAVSFYTTVFVGTVLKQNEIISEVEICGGILGIHGGGEGTLTWTGLSFQVPDVIEGAREIGPETEFRIIGFVAHEQNGAMIERLRAGDRLAHQQAADAERTMH